MYLIMPYDLATYNDEKIGKDPIALLEMVESVLWFPSPLGHEYRESFDLIWVNSLQLKYCWVLFIYK